MSVSEDDRLAVMLGMLPGSLLMSGVGILILLGGGAAVRDDMGLHASQQVQGPVPSPGPTLSSSAPCCGLTSFYGDPGPRYRSSASTISR